MRNPLTTERSTDIGLLLARLPLGVMFVIAGCSKLADNGGFRGFAEASKSHIPGWISRDVGLLYLNVLPFLAIVVGLMMVLGLVTRLGGFLASVVLTSIVLGLGTKVVYANGLPHPNLVYLSLALMLFCVGGGQISLDGLFWGKKPANGARGWSD